MTRVHNLQNPRKRTANNTKPNGVYFRMRMNNQFPGSHPDIHSTPFGSLRLSKMVPTMGKRKQTTKNKKGRIQSVRFGRESHTCCFSFSSDRNLSRWFWTEPPASFQELRPELNGALPPCHATVLRGRTAPPFLEPPKRANFTWANEMDTNSSCFGRIDLGVGRSTLKQHTHTHTHTPICKATHSS